MSVITENGFTTQSSLSTNTAPEHTLSLQLAIDKSWLQRAQHRYHQVHISATTECQ